MLAELRASAVLTAGAQTVVLTDASPAAVFALVTAAVMLTDLRTTAVLTVTAISAVRALVTCSLGLTLKTALAAVPQTVNLKSVLIELFLTARAGEELALLLVSHFRKCREFS